MDVFENHRNAAPQRRSMDPFWSEAEASPRWAALVEMAAEAWEGSSVRLQLRLPTGSKVSFTHGTVLPMAWMEASSELIQDPLLVGDASLEPRWASHQALVDHGFRFLAAIPISASNGEVCGSVWITGIEPRVVGAWEAGALRLLRQQAAALLLLEEQTLARWNEETHYRTILDSLVEGVVFLDTDVRILACNPSAERILRLTQDQMTGRRAVDPRFKAIREDGSPFPEESHPSVRALRTGKPQLHVVQGILHPDGNVIWVSINAQPLIHPWEEKPHGVVVSIFDITRMKEVEERLRVEATRDELTGLWNRRHFLERLEVALKSAKRYGDPLCLARCDLDGFKAVNDNFGHAVGDRAIRLVGQVLREELRGEDLAGRYGGDEFCMLFPRSSAAQAQRCLERIRTRLEGESLAVGASICRITATFGIASLMSITESEKDLFAAADRALYQAKGLGGNRVEIANITEPHG